MKRIPALPALAATVVLSLGLTGCFQVVEDGRVAVRTTATGTIEGNELGTGWHQTMVGKLVEFPVRDISMEINDKRYTTSENAPLGDFDFTIVYSINPSSVADLYKTKSRSFHAVEGGDVYLMYNRVHTLANNAAYKEVRKYKSLEAADSRAKIEQDMRATIDQLLEEDGLKGHITVSSVTVRSIQPNADIMASSVAVVKAQNELRVKQTEVEIAQKESERMAALSANSAQSIAYMNAQANLLVAQGVKDGKVSAILIPHGMTMFGGAVK